MDSLILVIKINRIIFDRIPLSNHYLGEITEENVSESVLQRIFSRFCIGK